MMTYLSVPTGTGPMEVLDIGVHAIENANICINPCLVLGSFVTTRKKGQDESVTSLEELRATTLLLTFAANVNKWRYVAHKFIDRNRNSNENA